MSWVGWLGVVLVSQGIVLERRSEGCKLRKGRKEEIAIVEKKEEENLARAAGAVNVREALNFSCRGRYASARC